MNPQASQIFGIDLNSHLGAIQGIVLPGQHTTTETSVGRAQRRLRGSVLAALAMLAAVVMILSITASQQEFLEDNKHGTTTKTPDNGNNATTPDNILFLIFAGGPTGTADMQAIMDTWGKRVRHAIIMTNTPDNLPVERIVREHHHHWRLHPTETLRGGPQRLPLAFWRETLSVAEEFLRSDVGDEKRMIHWVIRSDADTWWNVERLCRVLSNHSLAERRMEALMLGQAYGLQGEWKFKPVPPNATDRRNVYLSGGAGCLMTPESVRVLGSCLKLGTMERKCANLQEDVWLGCRVASSECHSLTVESQPGMFQRPDLVDVPFSEAISIHRAVGDGRNGWKHPSYYDDHAG